MKEQRLRRSAAFTLIELIVVIAIISTLATFIFSATHAARQSARRMECASRLREIGLALQNHHAVHDAFPVHYSEKGVRGGLVGRRLSGFFHLLPYVDQASLFNSANLYWVVFDSPEMPTLENRTTRGTRLSVFSCPSEVGREARVSYRFNTGRLRESRLRTLHGLPFDGPFGIGAIPRLSLITDGASRTALVSERLGGSFTPKAWNRVKDVKLPFGLDMEGSRTEDELVSRCLSSSDETWDTLIGRYWIFNGTSNTDYNHAGLPNDPRPSCGGANFGMHPPRSWHPDGVNVLFGDGHCEFITSSIGRKIWLGMGTHESCD